MKFMKIWIINKIKIIHQRIRLKWKKKKKNK